MNKFLQHIRLHVAAYFIPLMFAFILTVGGVGVFVAKIPAEKIKIGILQTLVVFAQSMSMHDKDSKSPHKNSRRTDELIKLESRRRKNEWREIGDEVQWTFRSYEEGDNFNRNYGKYRVIPKPLINIFNEEVSGETIQFDTNQFIKTKPHHWIIYFALMVGTLTFFDGFFVEVAKSSF